MYWEKLRRAVDKKKVLCLELVDLFFSSKLMISLYILVIMAKGCTLRNEPSAISFCRPKTQDDRGWKHSIMSSKFRQQKCGWSWNTWCVLFIFQIYIEFNTIVSRYLVAKSGITSQNECQNGSITGWTKENSAKLWDHEPGTVNQSKWNTNLHLK